MGRKAFCLILSVIFLLTVVPVSAAPLEWGSIYVDGRKLELEFAEKPGFGENHVMMVPLRKIFEEQGTSVSWNGNTKTVTAMKGDLTITYTVGEQSVRRNEEILTLPAPGRLMLGTMMVPVHFFSIVLGNTIYQDDYKHTTITISTTDKVKAKVKEVINGNTILVEIPDGEGVRVETVHLIGIDAPEMTHSSKMVQTYGKCAFDTTKYTLLGKYVYVETDVEQRDAHDHGLLGYVYLEKGKLFNSDLLDSGCAQLDVYPPNLRWNDFFMAVQGDAYDAGRGLWGAEEVRRILMERSGKREGATTDAQQPRVRLSKLDKTREAVEVVNDGTAAVNLSGWSVVQVGGARTFTFPDGFYLPPGGHANVFSGSYAKIYISSGDHKHNVFVWTVEHVWSDTGVEIAQLLDHSKNAIDEVRN